MTTIVDEYLLEPNRGGGGSASASPGRILVKKALTAEEKPPKKVSELPEENQRAIATLKPIAENRQGQKGDVLVMIWSWKRTGGLMPHSSVGHVAAAVQDGKGEWKIIQSQFPHGPGGPSCTTGPNTTIAELDRLRRAEDGHTPNAAYRVTVPNIGAYAKAAILDLRKPTWNWDPRWRSSIHGMPDSETNCTYGVITALEAGGASFSGLTASKLLTPILCWLPSDLADYLDHAKSFNVLREIKKPSEQWFVDYGRVDGKPNGMSSLNSIPW